MKKVILLHNIIAPYREPLFNETAKQCDLTVAYCNNKVGARKWNSKLDNNKYKFYFLKAIKIPFFTLNPGLIPYIIRHPADHYIIIDNEENVFSSLVTALFALLTRKKYTVWSGHIPITGSTIHPINLHKDFLHKWPIKNAFVFTMNSINRWLYKHSSSLLAYSDYSKDYLLQMGAEENKIKVGTQSMSTDLMPSPTAKKDLGDRKHFLYLGYLRPEKGINDLVSVFLNLGNNKADLHIVGEGPEKENLVRLASKSKNIYFYSYANEQERANWYSSVDFTILPTYYDPWAHTVTESLYYRTPVIVSTSAAASILIKDNKNGFIFEAGNLEQLSIILKNINDNSIKFKTKRDYSLYDVEGDATNFKCAIDLNISRTKA